MEIKRRGHFPSTFR